MNDDSFVAQAPIFIGGVERSGKTYMRLMLAAHPKIAVSRRTNMWTRFYGRYGNLRRTGNFERCLTAMLQNKHIRLLNPDAERIRSEFWQGPGTYAHLFALLHQHDAERQGKPRWGDQTEMIERCADAIFAAYPGARMIHMIRDPRDRFEAMIARRPQSKKRVGFAVAKWLFSTALARRNQQNYPGRYLIVRYESMVATPEETLRDVCRFINEAYAPAMLALENAPRFWRTDKRPSHSGASPLSPDFIGRYRQGLSPYQIDFIQKAARREMLLHGYTPDASRPGSGAHIGQYLLQWPVDAARLWSWRPLDVVMAWRG